MPVFRYLNPTSSFLKIRICWNHAAKSMRSAMISGEVRPRPGIKPQGPANPHGSAFTNQLKWLHCPWGYQGLGPFPAVTSNGPRKGASWQLSGIKSAQHAVELQLPNLNSGKRSVSLSHCFSSPNALQPRLVFWWWSSKGRAGLLLLMPTLTEEAGWSSGRTFSSP